MLAMVLLAGCDTVPIPNLEPPAYYHPANVYRYSPSLPASLKRVALLPLTTSGSVTTEEAGVDALEPSVRAELEKTRRFDVVSVSGAQLRQLTGRSSWRAEELLPLDFFKRLQAETGCDAVMFCQVTRYQAYPPLAVGWKLCLAMQGAGQNSQSQILWEVDEILDAGEPHVSKAARTYYSQHLHNEQPETDPGMILKSPTLFGQFGLSALFATLPDHAQAGSPLPEAPAPAPAPTGPVFPSADLPGPSGNSP